jgi:hypothetical protein
MVGTPSFTSEQNGANHFDAENGQLAGFLLGVLSH